MEYLKHIDTAGMVLSILCYKGLPVKMSLKLCTCISIPCFILANSADHDEMPPYVAFHLGRHCLPKYTFTGTPGPVPRTKGVNTFG